MSFRNNLPVTCNHCKMSQYLKKVPLHCAYHEQSLNSTSTRFSPATESRITREHHVNILLRHTKQFFQKWISPSMTGTFSESGSFGYQMLKRALNTSHVELPRCIVPWILRILKARKSVLRPRSFRSPNMLQDFESIIAISKCIFLQNAWRKGSLSRQRTLSRPRS